MCNTQSCLGSYAKQHQQDESAFMPSADPTITERCLIAPSPELAEKLKKQLQDLRSSAGGAGFMLRMAEQNRPGFNDGLIVPGNHFPLGTPSRVIRGAAAERAPLRGTLRVIVVLVDFSDKVMDGAAVKPYFENLFFGGAGSVREYYEEVSHGLVSIAGEVVGPFRLPNTLAHYANNQSGTGSNSPNARKMALAAVNASNATVNFANYDNDGNGYVDAFIVVHAGRGAEETGSSGDIWSHKWVLEGGEKAVDGTKIYAYLTVPEDAKLGVCVHELGHLLFGFPDLYDTNGGSEGVGNWCVMGGGSWLNSGNTPCHFSAWCKAQQGWVSVQNRTTNSVSPVNIADVKSSHQVHRLWKSGTMSNEYFLVENRQKTGYDAYLNGGGLLIWHIDDNVAGNSDQNHPKVKLMEADGANHLYNGSNRGDGGDCFPGSTGKRDFSDTSTPNSKSYAGASTCVSVTQISNPGAMMTARLGVTCINKTLKDSKDNSKEIKEVRKERGKDSLKDLIKDQKEGKEFKEKERKEIKEKERKEKDFKEFKEKEIREGKTLVEKSTDKIQDKRIEKPVTDKSTGFDKGNSDKFRDKINEGGGGFGDRFTPGMVGAGGGGDGGEGSIEARLAAIEAALGVSLQGGDPSANAAGPFIGEELRPDLSMGALSDEEDLNNAYTQAYLNAAAAKQQYEGGQGQ